MSGVARRPKIGAEISISVSGSIEPKAQRARQIPLSNRPTPRCKYSGRSESFPDGKTSIEGRKKTTKLQSSIAHLRRVSGAAMKMNPEQGTRSGFTTRCCLRPKLPGGVGVSGERMPPRPTLKATFKHQIGCTATRGITQSFSWRFWGI
jgi:hypothetical protein